MGPPKASWDSPDWPEASEQVIPDSDTSHRTYAQMTSEEKNKISHRRRPVQAMRNGLRLQ